MNRIKVIVSLSIVILLGACQSKPIISSDFGYDQKGEGSPFVQVDEQRFIRNGKPYYFVGANFWYGAYLGASSEGQQRLRDELDLLQRLGVDNLRVLALSEQTSLAMAVKPAIQQAPGVLDENLLIGLDVLLDEMARRDMVAVLYLNNFWQWSGGMAQYRAWRTGEPPFDPDTTGDWNGFMQNSALFYSDDEAQGWYRSAIRQIIERTNTVNGQRYRADPTIMAWQLANEPRPGSDEQGHVNRDAYLTWIESTAEYIKSLDDKHLVSIGSEGEMGTLQDIDLYQQAHNSPLIDYATFHLWPKNWSWLDIQNTELTYQPALAKAKSYVLRHIEVAEHLNKPTVLEEFGVERDLGEYSASAPTTVRNHFYQELYALIENQAKLGAPMAGSNFWTWGGFGRAKHRDYLWRPGDPFTGDPPQEHQGLNSIFATDESTLKIIQQHASALESL